MSYRIEIKFVGDAPEDEMARAGIIAAPGVREAVANLSKALMDEGFHHDVTARSLRSVPRRSPKDRAAASLAAE